MTTKQYETNSWARWANYEDKVFSLRLLLEDDDAADVAALSALDGQQLRDYWHAIVGKRMGLKSSTGITNKTMLVSAILATVREHRFGDRRPEHLRLDQVRQEDRPAK